MFKKTTILFGVLFAFLVIFSSCSKSNHPPSKPTNPYPADGAENITNTGLTLAWDADDPDNDILHYKIYMGKTAPFPLLGETDNESYTLRDSLDRGTTYYWKVVVFDEKGDSAIGDLWSFKTIQQEQTPNNPPNTPSSPTPSNGATDISVSSVTLRWSCYDPDGDALRYDVYFGTSTNPPRTAQDITSSSYTVNNLNYSTTYYWKIVAKDNETSTSGPVWSFTTEQQAQNNPPNPPSSPTPSDGASDVSIPTVTLEWNCTDPDGDALTYDLYFGPDSNPPLRASNFSSNSYTVSGLGYGKRYFWRIIARDEHNASTTGNLWSFTTETAYLDTFLPASGTYDTIIGDYYDPDPSYGYPWIALSSYGLSGADAYWTFYGLNDSLVDTLIIWVYSFDNGNDTDGEHYYVYDFDNAEWIHWGSSDKSENWHGYYTTNSSRYIDSNGMVRIKLVSGYIDHSHIKYVGIEEIQNTPSKQRLFKREILRKPLQAKEIPDTTGVSNKTQSP